MLTQVIDKQVTTEDGKTLFLKIVQHGDKQGWVTRQLIEYFNSNAVRISAAAKAANVKGSQISRTHIEPLKAANVVDINTTHMKFYTEEEVARIALHLNSKAAEDMVVYGFGVGVRAAQGKPLDVGIEPDLKTLARQGANQTLALIAKLEEAEAAKAKAEATVTRMSDYAADAALLYTVLAKDIPSTHPIIVEPAIRHFHDRYKPGSWEYANLKSLASRITRYLYDVHGLSRRVLIKEKMKNEYERAMFNRADIEAVCEKLKGEKQC